MRYISRHLPNLFTRWATKTNFLGAIVFGDAGDKFLKAVFAAHTSDRSNQYSTIMNYEIHLIADGEMGVCEQIPSDSKSLAVAPFLYFSYH